VGQRAASGKKRRGNGNYHAGNVGTVKLAPGIHRSAQRRGEISSYGGRDTAEAEERRAGPQKNLDRFSQVVKPEKRIFRRKERHCPP